MKPICEFVENYDINDITNATWHQLIKRLSQDVKINKIEDEKRYKIKRAKIFSHVKDHEFNGIINFLKKQSNGQIENEIKITSSSVYNSNKEYQPQVVVDYENIENFFHSNGSSNQWICFDFNEHKVIPTDYTIRSQPYGPGNAHPKNRVIEGSNDNVAYEIISEEKNNSCLNKKSIVHTFTMNRQQDKEYRFIRMRLTGPNWNSNHYFYITSFEIYGKLI